METSQIIILIIGISLGFFGQTISGFAAALIALPFILMVLSIQEAIAFLSVFFFIFSIILIPKNWDLINKKTIVEIIIGTVAGLILGIIILKFTNPIILKKFLAIFILLFVAHSHLKKKKVKAFSKLGVLFGFIGGLFSGLFSSGGAVYVVYIYNKLSGAKTIRATIIGTLGVVNITRVPMLIYADILTFDIFLLSLKILPFFLLSLYLGHKAYHKINEEIFKTILMIFLVLSAISMLVN